MRYLASAGQVRRLDQYTIQTLGVPGTELMEHAAAAVAEAVCELADGSRTAAACPLDGAKTAVLLCGAGNNGGDGFGCAWLLRRRGWQVRCFLIGQRSRMTADCAEMCRRLESEGGVTEPYDAAALAQALRTADAAVDALFGIGLNAPLTGEALEAVRLLNASGVPTVACDLPSGVAADTGEILGDAVRAAVTVTFTAAKPGLLLPPGMSCCGRMVIADIGIPAAALERESWMGELPDAAFVASLLPPRPVDSHKGNYGRVLLLCGSRGLTGAAALAARAALRTGAGLISLGVPESVYPILAVKLDEVMVFPLPDDEAGRLSVRALPEIRQRLSACDACLIGSGLGRSDEVTAVVHEVIRSSHVPLVVDADGINALSGHIDVLREAACPVILTPHDGELQRLGGDLTANRIAAAMSFSRDTDTVLLRKGYRTIVTDGGTLRINTTGNPGMAGGGSGDTLAGVLLALLGYGLAPLDAASAAAWLHGAAGDLAAAEVGQYGMTPSDLITRIPRLLP